MAVRPLVLTALLASLVLAADARAEGSLVMIGGALEDERIVAEIVRRAGGPGKARIGVFTSSSTPESQDPHAGTAKASNSVVNARYYVELFGRHGAEVSWIPIDLDRIENNRDPNIVRQIGQLTGAFFGGGDQRRHVQSLVLASGKDSPVLRALRRGLAEGDLVIAGTSAGTAAAVDGTMIAGGSSKGALRRAVPFGSRGLGFFKHGLLDTHFTERDRQARVVRLASDHGHELAFGVDEDTALVIDAPLGHAPRMKVLGRGGVSVFDLRDARRRPGAWNLDGVGFKRLGDGDRYDLASRRVLRGRKPLGQQLDRKQAGPHAQVLSARGGSLRLRFRR